MPLLASPKPSQLTVRHIISTSTPFVQDVRSSKEPLLHSLLKKPPDLKTTMTDHIRENAELNEFIKQKHFYGGGDIGEPQAVANVVVFLASEQNIWMTGAAVRNSFLRVVFYILAYSCSLPTSYVVSKPTTWPYLHLRAVN